jgi:hypothetical protein
MIRASKITEAVHAMAGWVADVPQAALTDLYLRLVSYR